MIGRAECYVLNLFGHMKRMSEERRTKRIYASDVEGIRRRKPKRR